MLKIENNNKVKTIGLLLLFAFKLVNAKNIIATKKSSYLTINSATETKAKKFYLVYYNVNFVQTNDNSPIDGLRNSAKKKRDDFGMTYAFGMNYQCQIKSNDKLFSIEFQNFNNMYSKQLGSITTLYPGHINYTYYEYLQKKHPDWNGVHLLNQNVISKMDNQIILGQHFKKVSYNIGLGNVNIDVDNHQFNLNVQKNVHKLINDRNYFEPDIFNNKFAGKNLNYLYLNAAVYLFKKYNVLNSKITIDCSTAIGVHANFTSNKNIKKVMPYWDAKTDIGFLKTKTTGIKRFLWQQKLHFDPYEVLPAYADPGSIGYYTSTFKVNFTNKKKHLIQYYFVPYQISIPINNKNINNNVLQYTRPKTDKGFIESFFYAGIICNLK